MKQPSRSKTRIRYDQETLEVFGLKKINKMRKELKLTEIKVTIVKCLRCDHLFQSIGVNNKMCDICISQTQGALSDLSL
jgi:hypothetical protein